MLPSGKRKKFFSDVNMGEQKDEGSDRMCKSFKSADVTHFLTFYSTEGQISPPQDMPFWHIDSFKLLIFKKLQTQEKL